jgi:hypothetical protein
MINDGAPQPGNSMMKMFCAGNVIFLKYLNFSHTRKYLKGCHNAAEKKRLRIGQGVF